MTFALDAQVAAVLAAAMEQNGPPPAPPAGDVASRRAALDAMLGYFNTTPDPSIAPFAGWSCDDNITAWNALLGPHAYGASESLEHRERLPGTIRCPVKNRAGRGA